MWDNQRGHANLGDVVEHSCDLEHVVNICLSTESGASHTSRVNVMSKTVTG